MPEYRLSKLADADVADIAAYTIERFGVRQARLYCDRLESCFQALAENPKLGRCLDQIAPVVRRFDHQSHVMYYRANSNGVLIIRVLHERMDPLQHF